MQVGVDVKCMHTNFGGCGFSSFGDNISFQIWPYFPFDHGLLSMVVKKLNQLESTQKVYASRD